MNDATGPVPQGTGPFLVLEPLGILHGLDAAAGLEAGIALPLAGGPDAFTMVRGDGQVASVSAAPAGWLAALARVAAPPPDWAGLGAGPLVMGILNATPDSFSDGGDHLDPSAAIAAGERMLADGADILDVGGESTRPGAPAVSEEQEQARVLPVIAALARQGGVISVDTRNAGTMARALDAGARIINDVTALTHDPAALSLVASRRCPVVLMHMRGTPATMNSLAVYADVAMEVRAELAARVAAAEAAGVARADIMLDPGFGFAKTAAQNIELMRRLPLLRGLGCPVLAGISRKATIGALAGETDPKRRGPGSMAAALFALTRGARVLRVHDVAETVQAVRVWRGFSQG
jgi:dihydropteroate synthase